MEFEVTARFTPPLVVLQFEGELDFATAGMVERSVGRAVEQGCNLVLMDLTKVSFIDSAGIDALVDAARRLNATSAHFSFNGLSPVVARMIELTGTDALFGMAA